MSGHSHIPLSPLPPVVVAGYFPPPVTGQSVGTERLAALLEPATTVHRISLTGAHGLSMHAQAPPTAAGALGYARAARTWRRHLRAHPNATVLWPSVSPKTVGHLRDALLVQPAFAPSQRVYGVVHWGIFDRLGAAAWLRPSVRRMVERLSGFVFLDPALADACAGFIPEGKRLVIPNTVADDVIASAAELERRREGRLSGAPVRVLFLSNMLPDKGYDDVIAAVGRLRRAGHAVEATFAGAWPDPSEAGRFEGLVAAEGVGNLVRYVGAVHARAEVKRLMLTHDVFAFPSRYPIEAQPLVLLEAMASGTPVVTTRNGAIASMLDDGVEGRFVPSRAPDVLADALDAYRDPDTWQAASRAARARFDAQFSPDAVRAAWTSLLASGAR